MLLQPYLIPSTIIACHCLTSRLWKQGEDAVVILQILQRITNPTVLGATASTLHKIILSICKSDLERGLSKPQDTKQGGDKIIESMSRRIETIVDCRRYNNTPNATPTLASIRANFDALCSWSAQASLGSPNSSYSTRSMNLAIQCYGANVVLSTLLDSVMVQEKYGFGDPAVDLATAIIAASVKTPIQFKIRTGDIESRENLDARLSLAEAIQLQRLEATATSRGPSQGRTCRKTCAPCGRLLRQH